ncbi:Squamosa promoter-binding-like protein [Thalictrum thalictroides]|uniref:Squamosa promoter-binding-like protein n=1 Tax=Thalictrum thalictroides TaxID=46969 RepID=A0A7J6V8N1_THATH|nr:Squamosa promoter-binding-like protein [Thalictrum thalictroides]
MELPIHLDDNEPSSNPFEWANLLDFSFEDEFNISWIPDHNPTVETTTTPSSIPAMDSSLSEASNRGESDSSDKIRKRDPRLTCENFLAGRIPCSCPEVDEMMLEEEEKQVEVGKKRTKLTPAAIAAKLRCQVPGCEVDISELKGYHKRHRVCLSCAHATSVVLDGETKRYCQQCGKFHLLPDFDEGKRSCRRKLEKHNRRRRRKPAEFKEEVEKEAQVDQMAEGVACDDKARKDETHSNESEDGNASPLSSHPGSRSTQSESVKSFTSFEEIQMEGGRDNSKYSPIEDNKKAYSSVCPTGRISFKLYDWNPAEFPRRLRHQIFQWLASMPVELEGYIRPGCIILTLFIAMPNFIWEKLSEDAACHIHNFVSAPESMLFGRGSITVYLNDMIFRVLEGGTSVVNVKMDTMAPRLHCVHPSLFEAGKPMEFVVCGSNLLQPKFRFLVSFAGQYLACDDSFAIPYRRAELHNGSKEDNLKHCDHQMFLVSFAGQYLACDDSFAIPYRRAELHNGSKEDNLKHCDHQMYKIYIPYTDPKLSGPAFIEVENESGVSNFIPVLFGDKHVCSEMKTLQQRLDDGLFAREFRHPDLDATSDSCEGFVLQQAAMSELLLDIGWLLKEPALDDLQKHLTFTQIQRFNSLLSFLIQNESKIVLDKILHALMIAMDSEKFYDDDNVNNSADLRLFKKNVEYASRIVNQRLRDVGEQVLHPGNSVEKADLSECCSENGMHYAVPGTTQDMEMARDKNWGSVTTSFYKSGETVPLINKEVVMDLTNGPQPALWPQKTCRRFLPTTMMRSRPVFLIAAATVMCFGICAVVLHPNKVGDFAVTIHRCLFGRSDT